MIRLSREQASLFGDRLVPQGQPKPQKPASSPGIAPRAKRNKAELPENQVEAAITTFLQSRGWQLRRRHVGSFIPTGVVMRILDSGEPLTKDRLFRCIVRVGVKGEADWTAERLTDVRGVIESFDWEAKAPGKRTRPEQVQWMKEQRALGRIVEWWDSYDFGGSHDFLEWYKSRYPKEF